MHFLWSSRATARAYGKHVHAVNEMSLGLCVCACVCVGADGLTLCRVTVYCSHTVSSMTGFWGEERKDYRGWVRFTGQINNVLCDVTTTPVHSPMLHVVTQPQEQWRASAGSKLCEETSGFCSLGTHWSTGLLKGLYPAGCTRKPPTGYTLRNASAKHS